MLKHHGADDTGWPTSNQGTTEQERQFYPLVIMGHGHPYGKTRHDSHLTQYPEINSK